MNFKLLFCNKLHLNSHFSLLTSHSLSLPLQANLSRLNHIIFVRTMTFGNRKHVVISLLLAAVAKFSYRWLLPYGPARVEPNHASFTEVDTVIQSTT